MGNSRKVLVAIAILVALAGLVSLNGQTFAADEKFKVGWIYIGHPGDAGWTLAHDEARKYMEKQLPWAESIYTPSGA